MAKYVKDESHNRYEAYCCEDIDKRVGALEEAVRSLVAGTIPDGTVTLAKLADDARTWSREINKGALLAEWVGTQEEYEEHLAANGGTELPNVKYIITDDSPQPPEMRVELGVRNGFKESGYYYIEANTIYNGEPNALRDSFGLVCVRVGGQDIVRVRSGHNIMVIDSSDGSVNMTNTESGADLNDNFVLYARRVKYL